MIMAPKPARPGESPFGDRYPTQPARLGKWMLPSDYGALSLYSYLSVNWSSQPARENPPSGTDTRPSLGKRRLPSDHGAQARPPS